MSIVFFILATIRTPVLFIAKGYWKEQAGRLAVAQIGPYKYPVTSFSRSCAWSVPFEHYSAESFKRSGLAILDEIWVGQRGVFSPNQASICFTRSEYCPNLWLSSVQFFSPATPRNISGEPHIGISCPRAHHIAR